MNTIKERKAWIDSLRAIAIILVVYGHCAIGFTDFFIFTSPIKMPLFFAISGYVFSMHDGNQGKFWKNWFIRLIIPWFCLALIPCIPKFVVNPQEIAKYLYGLISGEILWFMPCFVIAEVLHFYIRKIAKKDWLIIICCVVSFMLGLLAGKLNVLDFAMFNRALVVQLFFLLGYLFKKYEKWFTQINWMVLLFGVIVYVGLGLISRFVFPNQTLDVHLNQYYNLPYCFLMIVVGLLLIFSIFSKGQIGDKILSLLGQNTLIIYVWHPYAIWLLIMIFSFLGINNLGMNWWTAIIKTVWVCVICGFCSMFINKYLPWIAGKKRVKK